MNLKQLHRAYEALESLERAELALTQNQSAEDIARYVLNMDRMELKKMFRTYFEGVVDTSREELDYMGIDL